MEIVSEAVLEQVLWQVPFGYPLGTEEWPNHLLLLWLRIPCPCPGSPEIAEAAIRVLASVSLMHTVMAVQPPDAPGESGGPLGLPGQHGPRAKGAQDGVPAPGRSSLLPKAQRCEQ